MLAEVYRESPFEMPAPGSEPLGERPVVVGSGPAGVFAAYFLAERGYRPLVLERGRAVRQRIADMRAFDAGGPHDPESNYLFGEGGAGTFSDGKLTCRTSGPDVRRVLEIFAECKGKPSILYDHRPHLGSNRLPAVVKALRERIVALGGEFRFGCRVEDLDLADGAVRGLATSSGYLATPIAVLAIGHSARDTYEMLFRRGVPIVPKPFQIGLRIEQPQEQVNRAQYGAARLEERLGSADYSLVARGRQNVFSFCMCAGGYVMPSVSEPGYFCTNGMSLSRRNSPYANSGLMITLEPEHFGSPHALAGMMLQREYERRAFAVGRGEYLSPIQRADDFLRHRATTGSPPSSYPRGVVAAEVAALVPPIVAGAIERALPALDRRWRGLFLREATLVGPEAGAARRSDSCATNRRWKAPACEDSIRSAKGRATPAASSARRSTACERHEVSSPGMRRWSDEAAASREDPPCRVPLLAHPAACLAGVCTAGQASSDTRYTLRSDVETG